MTLKKGSDKIQVSVSIVPQKTFVKALAGDKADVNIVVPPGSAPSTYEPTPQEAIKLSRANIYFAIGVPTEKANIIPLVKQNKTKLVSLHKIVSQTYPDIMTAKNKRDVHIWLSIVRVIKIIEIIRDEMKLLDPENASYYEQNAKAYIKKLKDTKSYAEKKIS